MKFVDHSKNSLLEKIKEKRQELNAQQLWGTYFILFNPAKTEKLKMKKIYKPANEAPGLFTISMAALNNQPAVYYYLHNKLARNAFFGNHYDNEDAAIKLHINLNDIVQMDESVILGLIELLMQESESEHNDLHFFFKIIDPATFADPNCQHIIDRFLNTDQLTIYFDKYSSTGDLIRLTQKIEDYLLSCGIPQNKVALGPKDSLSFNSFVSARFDNNRLLKQYHMHRFFDIELKKFFAHQTNDLSKVPLCAFEIVFNIVLLNDKIQNINNNNLNGLTEEESTLVQNEFHKMLVDPQNYILAAQKISAPTFSNLQAQESNRIKATENIRHLLINLRKKSVQLVKENAQDRADIVNELHRKLEKELNSYHDGQRSLTDFKKNCNQAIQNASSHLEQHRGWKEFFINLLAGIATLGIIYAVNYHHNKGNSLFFKVNTDSVNKLEELAQSIANIDAPTQSNSL